MPIIGETEVLLWIGYKEFMRSRVRSEASSSGMSLFEGSSFTVRI